MKMMHVFHSCFRRWPENRSHFLGFGRYVSHATRRTSKIHWPAPYFVHVQCPQQGPVESGILSANLRRKTQSNIQNMRPVGLWCCNSGFSVQTKCDPTNLLVRDRHFTLRTSAFRFLSGCFAG